ncbi:MAG: hypothetical protein KF753_06750 [Caldilineaceae bacterium]|nr:hypothetical protein [Caldilineaceae bacterium]
MKSTFWRSALSAPLLFVALALLMVLLEVWIVTLPEFTGKIGLLSLAITADLTLGIPALYYLFFVHSRRAPAITLAPIFLLSVLLAHWVLPAEGKSYLHWLEWILPLVELGILVYAGTKIRAIRRRFLELRPQAVYPSDALDTAVQNVAGGNAPLLRLAATEFSMLYYGILGWFLSFQPNQESHTPFSYHRKTLYPAFLGLILVLIPLETLALHLVIGHWSTTAAWVVTGLSIYSAFWIVGDFHAIRLHPIVAAPDGLHLRCGFRWQTIVRWTQITALRKWRQADGENEQYANLAVIGQPAWLVEFQQPVTLHGLFNRSRQAEAIGLWLDDPTAFQAEIARYAGITLTENKGR